MRKRISAIGKNLLLSAVALVISLVIGITFLSLLPRKAMDVREIEVKNYEFQYTVKLNSDFFRDEEFKLEKTGSRLRVFLIGDSFVFGAGVDQNHRLDRLIEEKLNQNSPDKFEVYNIGASGANVRDYYILAKQFKDYDPDMVIVSFYVDNDIQSTREGTWTSMNLSHFMEKAQRVLAQFAWNHGWTQCKSNGDFKFDLNDFYQAKACQGEINPSLFGRFKVGDNEKYYQQLAGIFSSDDFTKIYLLKIKNLFPNKPFLLLINPSKYQVNNKYFSELRKMGFQNNGDHLVSGKLQETIVEWAQKNSIPYLDALPAMREKPDELYYAIDDHYNAQGNNFIAELVSAHIQSEKMLAPAGTNSAQKN